MIDYTLAAFALVLIFLLIIKALDFIYLFQVKEYRMDRFYSLVREEGFFHVFFFRSVRLPKKSTRNLIISAFAIFSFLTYYPFIYQLDLWVQLLLFPVIPLASFWSVLQAVLTTELFAQLKRRSLIKKAISLRSQSDAIFIGITGSYGKTSTKEFLYQIMSTKYDVAKTDANMNTEVGVAISIIKHLKKHTKYFITEMGAYKKGEIKAVCDIARPTFGILTAIGNQHMDIYGSRGALVSAKSELPRALPESGALYINKQIPEYSQIVEKIDCQSVSYTTVDRADIKASEITLHPDKTTADVHYKDIDFDIEVKLLGAHVIENLLPCIAIAYDLGMTKREIEDAVESIKPVKNKLTIHTGPSGTTIINDSSNSSVEGFIAALDLMRPMKFKRKFIISKGIIELGSEKLSSYKRIIHTLDTGDITLVTTDHLFKMLDRRDKVRHFQNEHGVMEYMKSRSNGEVLVLIEGRFTPEFTKFWHIST